MNFTNNIKDGHLRGVPLGWDLVAIKPRHLTDNPDESRTAWVLCHRSEPTERGLNWAIWIYETPPEKPSISSTCSSGWYLEHGAEALRRFNEC